MTRIDKWEAFLTENTGHTVNRNGDTLNVSGLSLKASKLPELPDDPEYPLQLCDGYWIEQCRNPDRGYGPLAIVSRRKEDA